MEPKALSFDAPPATVNPALKNAEREPGALVFGQKDSQPLARPAPATPSRAAAQVQAPAAVTFPPQTAPQPARHGTPAFSRTRHPLTETVLRRAAELGVDVTGDAGAALERAVARLLPFTVAVCEDWGNKSMENCRQIAQRCAANTAQFNALGSSRALDQALKDASPAEGPVAKLRRMVSGASPAELEPRVQLVRSGLELVLKDVRELMPEVVKAGRHLALKALAFRAVADVTGTPADATFEVLVERRRRLLAAALQQMELLTPQLQTLERTAALQLSQCDQLLHVTLPLLASQRPR